MDKAHMAQTLRDAGVVGAGGAGFPTAGKLAPGIDALLVNAVECEPLLHTDFALLQTRLCLLATGARAFADAMGAKEVFVCIKAHNADALGLADGQEISGGVHAKCLPDVYPMGDELIMIYQALGRVVPPGSLPSSVGVVVINAETALNIQAAGQGQALTDKWLTIGGAVNTPRVVQVPLGTPVQDLLTALGEQVLPGYALLDGGPAMGRVISPQTAVVTKTTKALLVLPRESPAVAHQTGDAGRQMKRTSSACCQCSFCTDMCPRYLLGYPLQPHKTLRVVSAGAAHNAADVLTASLCSGCGLCSFVACCQGVHPSVVMGRFKQELAKNRCGHVQSTATSPHALRSYRMVPSTRFARLVGAAPFVTDTPLDVQFSVQPERVRLGLRQHIGAPSLPVVKPGQAVQKGQMVAQAAEGLSVALHASISGVVRRVTEQEIEIAAGR